MTLQASGVISFSDLATEIDISNSNLSLTTLSVDYLGGSAPHSISEWYGWASFPIGYWWGAGRNYAGELIGTSHHYTIANREATHIYKYMAAGRWSTHLVKNDDTLWAAGEGLTGRLGLNSTTDKNVLTQVGSLTNWGQIDSNGNAQAGAPDRPTTACVKLDGTLWTWGDNFHGQLGIGDTGNRSSPVQVGGTTWEYISVGLNSVYGRKTDGTLWSWGQNNTYGALGTLNKGKRSSPAQITALGTTVIDHSGGYESCHVIKSNGTLWAWGYNGYGNLGDSTTLEKSSPIQIGALTTWAKVFDGPIATYAIKTDGTLWAWGFNNHYQLGQGNTTIYSSPVQVGSATNWVEIYPGGSYSVLALDEDGKLWGWGYNGWGECGFGSQPTYSYPTQVGSSTAWMEGGIMGYTHSLMKREGA